MLSKVDQDHSDYFSIFNQLNEIISRPSVSHNVSLVDLLDLHELVIFILQHATQYMHKDDLLKILEEYQKNDIIEFDEDDENGLLYR